MSNPPGPGWSPGVSIMHSVVCSASSWLIIAADYSMEPQVARPRMIASRRQVQTRADGFIGSPTNLVCCSPVLPIRRPHPFVTGVLYGVR